MAMRKVRLYGHLARRFGRDFMFDINSAAEAVRALQANFPEFSRHIIDEDTDGYRVITDTGANDTAEMSQPSRGMVRIVPVIAGAKKGGFLKVVLGIALVAIGFAVGGPIGLQIAKVGVGLALSGIAEFLAPTPKAPTAQPDAADNLASFLFDGPVNTVAQGNAIPVGYGRLRIGSMVISSGLTAENI